jgi:hypothetical protein
VAVLGRWSIVVCSIILVNFALTLLLSLNIIDLSHILPVMDHSLGEVTSNAFTLGSIAVGETVIVMTILGNLKKGESPYKVYLGGVLTGVGIPVLRAAFPGTDPGDHLDRRGAKKKPPHCAGDGQLNKKHPYGRPLCLP